MACFHLASSSLVGAPTAEVTSFLGRRDNESMLCRERMISENIIFKIIRHKNSITSSKIGLNSSVNLF